MFSDEGAKKKGKGADEKRDFTSPLQVITDPAIANSTRLAAYLCPGCSRFVGQRKRGGKVALAPLAPYHGPVSLGEKSLHHLPPTTRSTRSDVMERKTRRNYSWVNKKRAEGTPGGHVVAASARLFAAEGGEGGLILSVDGNIKEA